MATSWGLKPTEAFSLRFLGGCGLGFRDFCVDGSSLGLRLSMKRVGGSASQRTEKAELQRNWAPLCCSHCQEECARSTCSVHHAKPKPHAHAQYNHKADNGKQV